MIKQSINKQLRVFGLVFLSLFLFSVSHAQIEFNASAPSVVEVGEQFRLSYTLNAKGSGFDAPSIKDFAVLSGPNVSTSSSVQIVNGSMTQSVTYTYTFILVGKAAGKFKIPPATVDVKGKEYYSNPKNIEVVKGSASASAAPSKGTPSSKVDKANISNKNLFVAVNVDKKSLYQGEHLMATIKVYTKVPLSGFEDIKFPAYTGFWSQDVETPSQIQLERENVNGEIYEVGVFKKALLFPQRSGKITIDPFEITMLVRQQVRSSSPFDDFFGGSYKTIKKSVKSAPIVINVKPLPANKPADYNGAVGRMKMSASIDKTAVKTNEAVTLKVTISGNGNLKLIKPLVVDFPPDLDVYDPKTSLSTKVTKNGVNGSVTFEYLFIPRFSGNFRIAPISFSYFDTQSKKFKTVTSQEFQINVERGAGEEQVSSGVVSGLRKEDVRFLGKDIRFIKDDFKLNRKQEFVYGSVRFWGAFIGSTLLFFMLLIVRSTQIKQNANQTKVKNRKANKISKKRLKVAAKFMKANEDEKFYDEVLKAIWGYLSDKLSIPVANLSKDNVEGILTKRNLDSDILQQLMQLIDACEFARYAPSAVSGGTEDIYKKAGGLITKIDQKIK